MKHGIDNGNKNKSILQCVSGTIDYAQTSNALSRLCTFVPPFFFICNHGEMVTGAFDEMDDIVYGMDWNLCLIELQKYLVVMLAIIRQPIIIKGIFSLDSGRFTFKRVRTRFLH